MFADDGACTIYAEIRLIVPIDRFCLIAVRACPDVLVKCHIWGALAHTVSVIVEDGPAVKFVDGTVFEYGPDFESVCIHFL